MTILYSKSYLKRFKINRLRELNLYLVKKSVKHLQVKVISIDSKVFTEVRARIQSALKQTGINCKIVILIALKQ